MSMRPTPRAPYEYGERDEQQTSFIDRSDIALLAFAPLVLLLTGLLIGAFAGLIVLGFRLTSGG